MAAGAPQPDAEATQRHELAGAGGGRQLRTGHARGRAVRVRLQLRRRAVLRGHAGQVPGQQHAPGLAGTKRRRARDTARRGGGDARAGGDGAGRLNAPTMRKRGLKLASRS